MLTTQFNTSPPPLTLGKAPSTNRAPSRILLLFSQAESLRKMEHALFPEVERLFASLTARHGLKADNRTAWETDPDWQALDALNEEIDRLDDAFFEARDALLALPVTTVDELHAKVRVIAWNQPRCTHGMDYYEVETNAMLAEAERFLAGAA